MDGEGLRLPVDLPGDWPDQRMAQELVETLRHPLLILDGRLRVRMANEKFFQSFQVTPQDSIGRLLFELGNHEWDIPQLRSRLAEVLRQDCHFEQMELHCEFSRVGWRTLLINGRRIRKAPDHPPEVVVLAIEDITEQRRALDTLRDLESRMQAVVNAATDSIITIDELGRIESVNPAVERMFGYSAAELVGQNISCLMPPPFRDMHDSYLQTYLQTGIAKIIGIGREVQGQRKDHSVFPVDLAVSVFHQGTTRGFTGILRDATERKELEREIVEIAIREQRRIGQDLHDSTGQELTGLGMLAHVLAECLQEESHPQASKALRLVSGLDRALTQVRRFARGLAPVNVDADGLRAALTQLVGDVRADTGVACTLQYSSQVALPDSVSASHLFRIAQEAVTNAVRSAQPKNIYIRLHESRGLIQLEIEDDGIGIPDIAKARRAGLGLRIMAYRAELIGGALQIQPRHPAGTRVCCTLTPERRS